MLAVMSGMATTSVNGLWAGCHYATAEHSLADLSAPLTLLGIFLWAFGFVNMLYCGNFCVAEYLQKTFCKTSGNRRTTTATTSHTAEHSTMSALATMRPSCWSGWAISLQRRVQPPWPCSS